MKKLSAVVFCAGLGTRIKPIVANKPKCLIRVAGKPVIDYVLENLIAGGVNDIWVTIHHNPLPIIKHLGDSVKYFAEPKLVSQGQAIKELLPKLSDPFVVANGDTICDLDVRKLLSGGHTSLLVDEKSVFGGLGVIHSGGKGYGEIKGSWYDIGTPAGLRKARSHFKK